MAAVTWTIVIGNEGHGGTERIRREPCEKARVPAILQERASGKGGIRKREKERRGRETSRGSEKGIE